MATEDRGRHWQEKRMVVLRTGHPDRPQGAEARSPDPAGRLPMASDPQGTEGALRPGFRG